MIPIVLFAWIPLILFLFALLPVRRAVLTAFIVGWLFLPESGFRLPGFPDYNKVTATNLGVLLGAFFFDSGRVAKFRPRFYDLPALVYCLSPFLSALSNGLGAYEGLSAVAFNIFLWGIPYFIGRIYFNDVIAMRELAIAIVVGGLLYVPLCLFEMRFGPVLHKHVYGFMQQTYRESKRWGGYRPSVFLQHGLAVGMFMCTAALVGFWMWRSRVLRNIAGIPMGLAAMAVLVVAILCKSTGAILLLLGGLGVLYASVKLHSKTILIGLVLLPPVYMGARAMDLWSGQHLISFTADVIGPDRAESLAMRLRNEERLVGRALEQPVLGWGRFGRNHIIDKYTGKHTVSDGLWVIAMGQAGLVGLTAFTLMLLLPVWLLIQGCHARFWSQPAIAPAAAMAVLLVIYMIDNLFNAMANPIFLLAAGGLPQVAAICAAACAAAEAKAAPAREVIARPVLRRV